MSNVRHLFATSKGRSCSDTEASLTDHVVGVIGCAAQITRLKIEITRQLQAIDEVASRFENGELKEAISRESRQRRAELEKAFLILAQIAGKLSALHNQMVVDLL